MKKRLFVLLAIVLCVHLGVATGLAEVAGIPITGTSANVAGEAACIVAFVQDPLVIARILRHVGEPIAAPEVLPARAPPQGEMAFDESAGAEEWPDEDQTAGRPDDEWE